MTMLHSNDNSLCFYFQKKEKRFLSFSYITGSSRALPCLDCMFRRSMINAAKMHDLLWSFPLLVFSISLVAPCAPQNMWGGGGGAAVSQSKQMRLIVPPCGHLKSELCFVL